MNHTLKTWPAFYREIVEGEKTAELRKDDRNFQKGDTLTLQEFDPKLNVFTGHSAQVKITAVLRNFTGLLPGYCVLSIFLPNSASRFSTDMAGKRGPKSSKRALPVKMLEDARR